jgi:putative membrane protein
MKIVTSLTCAALVLVPVAANAMSSAAFQRKALAGDLFEIESARLALQKSRSPEIRRFARYLSGDHEKSAIALSGGAPVFAGATLAPQQERMLSQLRRARGADFDRLFTRMQIQSHRRAIDLYSDYAATGGKNARFAQETLPTLRRHLAMAESLRGR